MSESPSTKSNSSILSKQPGKISDIFVITPWANTVTTRTGNTITWPYFLSTLPKSLQSSLDGVEASSRKARSIMRAQGILLITRPRSLQRKMIDASRQGKSQSSVLQAEILRLARVSARTLLHDIKRNKAKSYCRNAVMSRDASALTDEFIQSVIGPLRKSEPNWEYRSRTEGVRKQTPSTKATTR